MAGNKEVLDLPVVPVPDDGYIYVVKDGVNYRVPAGTALGLATLGADGILNAAQRPASSVGATGSLIAGTGVILSGTIADRLVGTGDVTITASGGTSSSVAWGAITGTLSNQADLQSALNAKANTTHTHAAGDVTTGTFSTARLGSGTADTTKYLRGDGSWQTVSASVAWGGITGTLSSQTDLNTALAGKSALGHTHAAGDIVSGVLAPARLGTGSASSTTFLRGDGTWALTSTGAATWGSISGTLADQTDLNTALSGKAPTVHTHAAGDVTTGVFSTGRLGTGVADSTKYLRGDGSWQLTTIFAQNAAATDLEGSALGAPIVRRSLSGDQVAGSPQFSFVGNTGTGMRRASTNVLAFDTAGAERVKVEAGNTTITGDLTLSGTGTGVDWVSTSDERLKYNIVDALARDRLADMLRFVSFIYSTTDEERLGLIAQEVLKVAPEYVRVDNSGYLAIDKAGIALEAVIGLSRRVQQLEAKVG